MPNPRVPEKNLADSEIEDALSCINRALCEIEEARKAVLSAPHILAATQAAANYTHRVSLDLRIEQQARMRSRS